MFEEGSLSRSEAGNKQGLISRDLVCQVKDFEFVLEP